MERLINRRQQGDLGEISATEWLIRSGARVSIPLGHSPDYDLIVEVDRRLLRIQVKTSTHTKPTKLGEERWEVSVCTNGGNQSWTGVVKHFDPTRVEALFVHTGNGRRWLIPPGAAEGTSNLRLGGRKYSEFEIEAGNAILPLVYDGSDLDARASRIDAPGPGERRSWRAGLDCKSSASLLSGFDSHLPHSTAALEENLTESSLGRPGQALIRRKRQMTLPSTPFSEAGLRIGDRLRFRAEGMGRIVLERIEPPPALDL